MGRVLQPARVSAIISIAFGHLMVGILIKDFPEWLHRLLKRRAAANRRSVNSEIVTILEAALDDHSEVPTLDEVDRMRVRGARPLTKALLDRARRDHR